ncbi:MAG TPA: DNA (cytosine-5-)-methyltransferase [Pyrinomonadaceae bacterium]|nr:DNA (cytosine-5-)-methyltransferase [Pyrinomonadaceae bacterium]
MLNKDIRNLRTSLGLGQRELAIKANVSLTELSKCERGLVFPDDDFFAAIGSVLLTPIEHLKEAHAGLTGKTTPGEGYSTALTDGFFVSPRRMQVNRQRVPIVDLFCGIGGFSRGFERTGTFQVVAGVDLLPDRVQTFCENHASATAFCGDINRISFETLADESPIPDVVIGGPPCQGFSSIRPFRTLTEGDPRNNLFEHFALFVKKFRPKWFVFENVVGLLTHQGGKMLKTILEVFEGIGYRSDWKILNAALYGLPQRRERLVVVGNRNGANFKWPATTHHFEAKSMAGRLHGQSNGDLPLFGEILPSALSVMDAIHDLPEIAAGQSASSYRDDIEPTDYEKKLRGAETRLTLHESTAHTPRMVEIIRMAGSNRFALPSGMTSSGFSTCYSRLEPNRPSVTLTVNFVHPASNKCIHPYQDRALTPREGARLQGFEDSFIFKGTRSQIVKQIGNAVPPLLGQVLAEALIEHL